MNTFPGLVLTARHTMGVDFTRNWEANLRGATTYGGISDWGEVVTRYLYENVEMDYLSNKIE